MEISFGGQKCSLTGEASLWSLPQMALLDLHVLPRGTTVSCTRLLSNAPSYHFSHIRHYDAIIIFYSLFLVGACARMCVLPLLSIVRTKLFA